MASAMDSGPLRIVPLGGLGEIGLNCLAIEVAGYAVAIDCGLMFPDPSMLGIDRVIPDLGYLKSFRERFLGFVMTHGHEDHVGALPYVLRELPAPVFATPMAAGILTERLREHELLSDTELNVVQRRKPWQLGPFHFEAIHMTHSILDSVALAIRTPAGTVIHTGDFKLDETPIDGVTSDLERLSDYANEGVAVLLSDSTGAETPGRTPSERSVHGDINKIFEQCEGQIFFSTFSSHIHRLSQVIELSQLHGRRVSVIGRSMSKALRIATQLGYLEYPPGLFVDSAEAALLPAHRVTHLIAGSQAEPMSSLLRIAEGGSRQVTMGRGDAVILSSRVIPGNEKPVGNLLNHIYRRGAVAFHSRNCDVHTSGHGSQDELREMLRVVRPRYFVPLHGEYRHLVQHCGLAHEVGLAPSSVFLLEDGDVLEVDATGARQAERVASGRIFVDGKGIGDVERAVLRDRRHLSEGGFILAVLAIDQRTGELISGPDLITRGLAVEHAEAEYLEQARRVILETLEFLEPEARTDSSEVKEEIRKGLKRYFAKALERRPVIVPFVMEM